VAGNWRIRHKLMLGMALIVVVMALLLAGTLKGVFSFKAMMRTFDGKLPELDGAESLRTQIRALLNRPGNINQQYTHVTDHLQKARAALDEYNARLQETIETGRDPDQGYRENAHVRGLQKHFNALEQRLGEARQPRVIAPGSDTADTNDLLAEGHPVRKEVDELNRTANDLVNILMNELRHRVSASRSEQRTTVWVLIVTSTTALLLMAGMLTFFYRSVVRPLRILERGVGGVARGDFSRRIEIHSGDEIQDLGDAFNEMTGRLREMYANLAQQVNERSRQLVRSERLAGVGFLAAGVAHEINNPLASIAFCSEALDRRIEELLRQRPTDPEEQKVIAKYLKMIQEEAFRCKEITEKLLAFSRGGERKRERIDLAEVVQGVLDVVQHLQNCKGKQLVFDPREPVLAWANAQEIKQVFLNLVVNALDSMDEGGRLMITHGKRVGMVELVFNDTGCGMSAEVLENLFEPFFTRNRTGKGTGLGLSISHRIITQHGGEIEATSDGAGKGSTFIVRLPIDAPAETAPEAEAAPDPKQLFAKLSTAQRKVA
jgi:two-component system, NtrC family, sensor kinase